jgi:RND family efflux transporter MFP subunit
MGSNHKSLMPLADEPGYDRATVDSPPMHNPPVAEKPMSVGHSSFTRWGAILFAIVLIVGLAILFARGLHARHSTAAALEEDVQQEANAPIPVDVVRVQVSPAAATLNLPGEARSFYETTLFARTSGYISKWFVDIGDRVKSGQVLANIETPELDDDLKAAQAKVRELQAEVHVAETNLNFAKVSFERWQALAPQGAVSPQDRDQKKAELDSSSAKLEAAKAQVALGEADVGRLNTLESFKNVRAPFDGVITERHIDIGALVTAGSTSSTTPLYSISQQDTIRIFVDVPQAAAPLIKVGMPAIATTREYPGRVFAGTVDRTRSAIDPQSKMLRVEVLVSNKDLALLPGMYIQVQFENTRAHPPLRVPAGALCFRSRVEQLAVVGNDDRVEMHNVQITRELGDFVEVQGDINSGALVALNVGNNINSGDRVNPHEASVDANTSATQPKSVAADESH